MTGTATQTISLRKQIDQYRQEAAEAKANKNFEFAFVLLDKADQLEKQL